MLRTYHGEQEPRIFQAPPCAPQLQLDVAHGTIAAPRASVTASCAQVSRVAEDDWMPQDDSGPLGAARNRRARPTDAAVLGALVSGPVGAEAVAAPWAVGVGATGTLARPTSNRRAAAAARAHDCRAHELLGDGGLPQFVAAEGDSWRLSYRTTSGIPWSLGHWPYLPRLGFGGQVAYYSADATTVCAKVPPKVARQVATRLTSWWWPLAHRLGLALGPWALPTPKDEPHRPLQWLAPGDCAELCRSHHELLSVGIVLQWLRIGPQWTGQTSSVLRLDRLDDGRLDVVLEQMRSQRTLPIVFDLPILAAVSVDRHTQTLHRRHWLLDGQSAAGALAYQLVLDSHLRRILPRPLAPGDVQEGSVHSATSSGQGATGYLPWTLLSRQVRGVGASRASGVASVRRDAHGMPSASLWVEGETETLSGGHDAYRIGLHATEASEPHTSPARVALGVRLHVEKLSPERRRALVALLQEGLGLKGRPRRGGAADTVAAAPRDVRIHLQFVVPTRALFEAKHRLHTAALARRAQALGSSPEAVATFARALAQGLLGLGTGGDVLLQDQLRATLRQAGPVPVLLLGQWLADADSCQLEVRYGETDQLLAEARAQAATRPRVPHTRSEQPTRPLWRTAQHMGLRAQLLQHEQALAHDALLALCPQAAQTMVRRTVLQARELLV